MSDSAHAYWDSEKGKAEHQRQSTWEKELKKRKLNSLLKEIDALKEGK